MLPTALATFPVGDSAAMASPTASRAAATRTSVRPQARGCSGQCHPERQPGDEQDQHRHPQGRDEVLQHQGGQQPRTADRSGSQALEDESLPVGPDHRRKAGDAGEGHRQHDDDRGVRRDEAHAAEVGTDLAEPGDQAQQHEEDHGEDQAPER